MKKISKIFSLATLAGSLLSLAAPTLAAPLSGKTKTSKAAPTPQAVNEDEAEPNIEQSKHHEYKCELGNSLTLYTNADDQQVAMRWKKRLYKMTRVTTSTGADRFENQKAGFVYIGIPAKGLLLDSHKGQQLANECKTTEPVLAQAHETQITPAQAK